jgi:hypothetical protein
MRTRLILFSLIPAAFSACSSTGPDRITDPGSLSGATIQVVAEGDLGPVVSHRQP